MLDAVLVKDTHSGSVEKVCRDCVGAQDHIEGGPVHPAQPNRRKYKREGHYRRAVKKLFSCDRCGGELPKA